MVATTRDFDLLRFPSLLYGVYCTPKARQRKYGRYPSSVTLIRGLLYSEGSAKKVRQISLTLQCVPDVFICRARVVWQNFPPVVSAGERNGHAEEQEHPREDENGRTNDDLWTVR